MTKNLYVWTRSIHPQGLPIILGHLKVDQGIGRFVYGKSYLSRPGVFALDPINLPLQADPIDINSRNGVPGAIADAGPDSWGRTAIAALFGITDLIDILLKGNGLGAGGLVFSQSPDDRPKPHQAPAVHSLQEVELAVEKLQTGHVDALTAEERALLAEGSSMGGARPKLTLRHNNREVIVKLNRHDDAFSHARVEHATMTLAQQAGIDVPASEVIQVGGQDLYLINRFDRRASEARSPFLHYQSAASVLNARRLVAADFAGYYSYAGIAQLMGKLCSDVSVQRRQLFRRMVFNVLMHNTDDHARNHGFLLDPSEQYPLSPAFDLLPNLTADEQALGVGTTGRQANLANCLSRHTAFNLKADEAQHIVEEVRHVATGWADHFHNSGVGERDIRTLEAVLNRRQDLACRM